MDSFPGMQLHCHNYRHAELFQGKRVLVVGASFSGLEYRGNTTCQQCRMRSAAHYWEQQLHL
jgi:hypothetical protein